MSSEFSHINTPNSNELAMTLHDPVPQLDDVVVGVSAVPLNPPFTTTSDSIVDSTIVIDRSEANREVKHFKTNLPPSNSPLDHNVAIFPDPTQPTPSSQVYSEPSYQSVPNSTAFDQPPLSPHIHGIKRNRHQSTAQVHHLTNDIATIPTGFDDEGSSPLSSSLSPLSTDISRNSPLQTATDIVNNSSQPNPKPTTHFDPLLRTRDTELPLSSADFLSTGASNHTSDVPSAGPYHVTKNQHCIDGFDAKQVHSTSCTHQPSISSSLNQITRSPVRPTHLPTSSARKGVTTARINQHDEKVSPTTFLSVTPSTSCHHSPSRTIQPSLRSSTALDAPIAQHLGSNPIIPDLQPNLSLQTSHSIHSAHSSTSVSQGRAETSTMGLDGSTSPLNSLESPPQSSSVQSRTGHSATLNMDDNSRDQTELSHQSQSIKNNVCSSAPLAVPRKSTNVIRPKSSVHIPQPLHEPTDTTNDQDNHLTPITSESSLTALSPIFFEPTASSTFAGEAIAAISNPINPLGTDSTTPPHTNSIPPQQHQVSVCPQPQHQPHQTPIPKPVSQPINIKVAQLSLSQLSQLPSLSKSHSVSQNALVQQLNMTSTPFKPLSLTQLQTPPPGFTLNRPISAISSTPTPSTSLFSSTTQPPKLSLTRSSDSTSTTTSPPSAISTSTAPFGTRQRPVHSSPLIQSLQNSLLPNNALNAHSSKLNQGFLSHPALQFTHSTTNTQLSGFGTNSIIGQQINAMTIQNQNQNVAKGGLSSTGTPGSTSFLPQVPPQSLPCSLLQSTIQDISLTGQLPAQFHRRNLQQQSYQSPFPSLCPAHLNPGQCSDIEQNQNPSSVTSSTSLSTVGPSSTATTFPTMTVPSNTTQQTKQPVPRLTLTLISNANTINPVHAQFPPPTVPSIQQIDFQPGAKMLKRDIVVLSLTEIRKHHPNYAFPPAPTSYSYYCFLCKAPVHSKSQHIDEHLAYFRYFTTGPGKQLLLTDDLHDGFDDEFNSKAAPATTGNEESSKNSTDSTFQPFNPVSTTLTSSPPFSVGNFEPCLTCRVLVRPDKMQTHAKGYCHQFLNHNILPPLFKFNGTSLLPSPPIITTAAVSSGKSTETGGENSTNDGTTNDIRSQADVCDVEAVPPDSKQKGSKGKKQPAQKNSATSGTTTTTRSSSSKASVSPAVTHVDSGMAVGSSNDDQNDNNVVSPQPPSPLPSTPLEHNTNANTVDQLKLLNNTPMISVPPSQQMSLFHNNNNNNNNNNTGLNFNAGLTNNTNISINNIANTNPGQNSTYLKSLGSLGASQPPLLQTSSLQSTHSFSGANTNDTFINANTRLLTLSATSSTTTLSAPAPASAPSLTSQNPFSTPLQTYLGTGLGSKLLNSLPFNNTNNTAFNTLPTLPLSIQSTAIGPMLGHYPRAAGSNSTNSLSSLGSASLTSSNQNPLCLSQPLSSVPSQNSNPFSQLFNTNNNNHRSGLSLLQNTQNVHSQSHNSLLSQNGQSSQSTQPGHNTPHVIPSNPPNFTSFVFPPQISSATTTATHHPQTILATIQMRSQAGPNNQTSLPQGHVPLSEQSSPYRLNNIAFPPPLENMLSAATSTSTTPPPEPVHPKRSLKKQAQKYSSSTVKPSYSNPVTSASRHPQEGQYGDENSDGNELEVSRTKKKYPKYPSHSHRPRTEVHNSHKNRRTSARLQKLRQSNDDEEEEEEKPIGIPGVVYVSLSQLSALSSSASPATIPPTHDATATPPDASHTLHIQKSNSQPRPPQMRSNSMSMVDSSSTISVDDKPDENHSDDVESKQPIPAMNKNNHQSKSSTFKAAVASNSASTGHKTPQRSKQATTTSRPKGVGSNPTNTALNSQPTTAKPKLTQDSNTLFDSDMQLLEMSSDDPGLDNVSATTQYSLLSSLSSSKTTKDATDRILTRLVQPTRVSASFSSTSPIQQLSSAHNDSNDNDLLDITSSTSTLRTSTRPKYQKAGRNPTQSTSSRITRRQQLLNLAKSQTEQTESNEHAESGSNSTPLQQSPQVANDADVCSNDVQAEDDEATNGTVETVVIKISKKSQVVGILTRRSSLRLQNSSQHQDSDDDDDGDDDDSDEDEVYDHDDDDHDHDHGDDEECENDHQDQHTGIHSTHIQDNQTIKINSQPLQDNTNVPSYSIKVDQSFPDMDGTMNDR